jgi:hypothetical protein
MHYEKAVETFTEINTPLSLAECEYEFGLVLRSKGDMERAKTELRRAANLYLHLELDPMVKKTLKEIESLDQISP